MSSEDDLNSRGVLSNDPSVARSQISRNPQAQYWNYDSSFPTSPAASTPTYYGSSDGGYSGGTSFGKFEFFMMLTILVIGAWAYYAFAVAPSQQRARLDREMAERVMANAANRQPQPSTKPVQTKPVQHKYAASEIKFPSVAAARQAVRGLPGIIVSTRGDFTILEDRPNSTLWVFTSQQHPAYPAVARRHVGLQGNNLSVELGLLCESTKSACDNLFGYLQDVNKKVR